MKYYRLRPEVAGGLGDNAILADPHARPPRITKLHFEFEDWFGDPIVTTVGTYIILESLKEKLSALRATGATFGEVEISISEVFEELHPGYVLPKFVWLQVTGNAGRDDFGWSQQHRLVVSQRILDLLEDAGMSHCDIAEFKGTP
jgi:hypothetical protein